uniref:Peptidase A2 domain-containing protein n=1 Tax=Panagrolaimus davidi TaxID=227884 RepID=A0A914R3X3_9BILA
MFIQMQESYSEKKKSLVFNTVKNLPNIPKPPRLISLKKITLKEMDATEDKVYDGYVLEARILEWSYLMEGIATIIEDKNGDVERLAVYNWSSSKEDFRKNFDEAVKTFRPNSIISIINPYMRMAKDMRSCYMTNTPPPGQNTGTGTTSATASTVAIGISAADLAAALQAYAATSGQPAPQPIVPKFEYDPAEANGAALWFDRLATTFRSLNLSDAQKVTYTAQALDVSTYKKVARALLPDHLSTLNDFAKLETTMVGLFDRKESVFAKRYALFQTEWKGPDHESIAEYTSRVRESVSAIDPANFGETEIQTLVYLMGMKSPALEVFRIQVLNLLKKDPTTTLVKCQEAITATLETQREQKLPMGSSVNYVKMNNTDNGKKPFIGGGGRRQSSPCASCGGQHDRQSCRFRHEKCRYCGLVGHIERVCRSKKNNQSFSDFDDAPDSPRKQSRRPTNTDERPQQTSHHQVGIVHVDSPSTQPTVSKPRLPPSGHIHILNIRARAHDLPCSSSSCGRIMLNISIKQTSIHAQLDTGSDITVLALQDYVMLKKPFLDGQPFYADAAGNTQLLILGSFKSDVTYNGQIKRVDLHVANVQKSLLGLDFVYLFGIDKLFPGLAKPTTSTVNVSSATSPISLTAVVSELLWQTVI